MSRVTAESISQGATFGCSISRNNVPTVVKRELAENPSFSCLYKTLWTVGSSNRGTLSKFFKIFFAFFFSLFSLHLHRAHEANLVCDMELKWYFSKKTCFCAPNKGGFDGIKISTNIFSFFKVTYKQKPFKRTLLELLGTKHGFSAPFWS